MTPKNLILYAVTTASILSWVIGVFTIRSYPTITGIILFLSMEWILLMMYANRMFVLD